MNPQRNGDPRFRITYVPQAKEQFRQIVRRAGATRADGRTRRGRPVGRIPSANRPASVRRIDRGIPDTLGSTLRHAAVGPIVVHYGVHQEQSDVVIRGFVDLL